MSSRTVDALTAPSCFGLMLLDVPGLAEADNSLGRVSATPVPGAGARRCCRAAGCRTWWRWCSWAGCTS
ncbi:hypothetical protein RB196_28595 [Streptomyces sp. PmtA]|uniref:hypothetical protein n=1 Tax=Streptomyces sp. PmtA TaxID=3074275 RepID=UPI00301539F5